MEDNKTEELFKAVDTARVELVKTYCIDSENPIEAIIQLSTLFLYQMYYCLRTVYEGNDEVVVAHILLLLSKGFTPEEPVEIR